MKKLVFISVILFVFSISASAQMGGGMMGGGQEGYGVGPGMMWSGEGGNYCDYYGKYSGLRRGYDMGPGMMGGRIGKGYDGRGRGHFRRWFQYGVTLMLRNADNLGLGDEQIKKLYEIKRKYSKDIIKQDAELKIAEIDLGALFKEPEINLPEVKEALKKIENGETQIRFLRIMAFDEARKVLTDEQKQALKKLMELRPAPGRRGMITSPEPEEGEETEGTVEEEGSKTDIHGH